MAEQELREWAELSRSITDDDRIRHTPPPMVWDNIAAALAADADVPSTAEGLTFADPIADEIVPPEAVIDLSAARERRAPVEERRRRRNLVLAGAASVLVFLVGLSLLTGIGEDPDVTTFVADVNNAELPEPFDGTATAIVAVDEAPMLEIAFAGELPSDEPVELWLIKPDLSDMRSLGIVNPGSDSWSGEWPADLDPAEYSLVDLSIEPADGDPTHSGRSILRGQLTLT